METIKTKLSRRRFGVAVGGGMAAAGTAQHLFAQKGAQPNTLAWAPKLSQAVITGVTAAGIVANRKAQSGQLTGSDIRNFANVTGILFAHLDEIGMVADMDKRIKSSGAFNAALPAMRMAVLRSQAAKAGFTMDDKAFIAISGSQEVALAAAREIVERQGLRGLHAVILAELRRDADRLDEKRPMPLPGVAAADALHLQQVTLANFCAAVAVVNVYTATWGALTYWEIITVPCLGAAVTIISALSAIFGFAACT